MAETFDRERAGERHQEIIRAAQRVRDGITKDVIDYYYNAPTSEAHDHEQREGMRKFLRLAAERIDDILHGPLS